MQAAASVSRLAMAEDEGVRLFVDYSNIWFGARGAAELRGEPIDGVRLCAERLYGLMAAGRRVASATLVVNSAVPESVCRHLRRSRFDLVVVENGASSGTEQGADEKLQNDLLLGLFAWRPGVVVLATGDGAGWRRGVGFIPTILAARRCGFGVEVLAFRSTLNTTLRAVAETVGTVIELDDRYREITFLEGWLRALEPVDLGQRPTTTPHPWTFGESAAVLRILGTPERGRAA
jgi:hypothetical protein